MILYPKARPVRIRIYSGGEEHSSFESLKSHFKVKDLLAPAKDGRLGRWLEQQGKEHIAKRIEVLKESLSEDGLSDNDYLCFVSAIYIEDSGIEIFDTKAKLQKWWSSSKYCVCPECQDLTLKVNYDYATFVYDEQKDSRTKEEWITIFKSYNDSKAEDVTFNWRMYNITDDESYLKKAAELGHLEAKEKLNWKINVDFLVSEGMDLLGGILESKFGRFAGINKNKFALYFDRLKEITINSGSDVSRIINSINYLGVEDKQDVAFKKEIINLLELWQKSFELKYSLKTKISVNDIVGKVSSNSILKYETLFIKGMLYEVVRETNRIYYDEIKDEYPPAALRLEMQQNKANHYSLFAKDRQGNKFELNKQELDFNGKPLDKRLEMMSIIVKFILCHMFDKYSYEIR